MPLGLHTQQSRPDARPRHARTSACPALTLDASLAAGHGLSRPKAIRPAALAAAGGRAAARRRRRTGAAHVAGGRRHGLRPGSRAPRGRPQTPRCPPGTGCRTSRSRRCCRTRGRRPGRARTPARRPAPCSPGAQTGRSHCARRACASGASARTPRAAAQAGVPVSMRDCPDTKTERQRASARSLPVKVRRAHACQRTLLADRGTARGVACLHMLEERAPRLAAHRCCTWTAWIVWSWKCNWIR